MNKKLEICISYFLVIIWLITIFYLSSMDTNESNDKSTKTISKVITVSEDIKESVFVEKNINIEGNNEQENDINKSINSKEQEINILAHKLNPYLRKCTHALVYMLLAILVNNALESTNIYGKKKIVITLIFCFLYAVTDEYHQTFVYGRSGRVLDVFIDTGGTIIGNIIYALYVFLIKRLKQRKLNKV